MRAPVFWAHVKMLSRLEASEQQARVQAQLASNDRQMPDDARDEYIWTLERRSAGEPEVQEGSIADVVDMGIEVVRES